MDARNKMTKWEYDTYGRVKVVRRYPTSTSTQEIVSERVEYYDALPSTFYSGAAFSLPSGSTFVLENALGRLVMTRTGGSRILELYSWTDGGQLKRKRLEAENQNLEVQYAYDTSGRVSRITWPDGRIFKYSYDANGRPNQLNEDRTASALPDWLQATAVFDDSGRLKSVGGLEYEYNSMGQLSRAKSGSVNITYNYVNAQGINDGRVASQTRNGVTTSYAYDYLGRLETANTSTWLQSYDYDGFGNLVKRWNTLPGQAPVLEAEYPVNPATNRRTGSGSYDAAGNHKWHPSVEYDTDNRMIAAPGPQMGTVETYDYAPDNRRVVRKVPGTNGFTQITLWVGSVRVVTRRVPLSGVTTDTNHAVFAGMKFLSTGYSSGITAEGWDRLGSSSAHRPYGEDATGSFATYKRDTESTGLDYADQRYYAPGQGRFLTADPYMASGGTESPASWNRYAYVEGDPVNWVDPRGLWLEAPGNAPSPSPPPAAPTPTDPQDACYGPFRDEVYCGPQPWITAPEAPFGESMQKKLLECIGTVVAEAERKREQAMADLRKGFLEGVAIAAVFGGFTGGLPGAVFGAGGQVVVDGLWKFVIKQAIYMHTVYAPAIAAGKADCDKTYGVQP